MIAKAGISKKYILTENPLLTSAYNPFQKPETLGQKAGAGYVLYVRLEEFEALNLHSDTIYSGQMKARAFLIQSSDGKVLCPDSSEGIIADVSSEMDNKGREKIVAIISDAAAHCIVRHFYSCPKYEYKVNEERSTMNEMIRQEVY
jgi:hypothetical protein